MGNPVDKSGFKFHELRAEDGSKYDVKGGKIGQHARVLPNEPGANGTIMHEG